MDKIKLIDLRFEVVPNRIVQDGNRWRCYNLDELEKLLKEKLGNYPQNLGEKKVIGIYIEQDNNP